MTRAIGDSIAHSIGVTAEPEVLSARIQPDDRYLVLVRSFTCR
jgi:hypothetical protein